MSIANDNQLERRPVHPGEILREDFMPDYRLTVSALADALGVSRQSVNELVRERRAVSPEMALRLGRLFDSTLQVQPELRRVAEGDRRGANHKM